MRLLRKKNKNIFREYGYMVKNFHIEGIGNVQYAQWLHPSEKSKTIDSSNIEFFAKISKKGSLLIDIGAHTGDTALPMALAAGINGKVIAFEPNKYVYKILEVNASLNKEHTNIIPLCRAITREDGEFIFNYSDASFCNGGYLSRISNKRHGHNYELQVSGINLERYLMKHYENDLERLSLIKIDAEGYDKEIIKSMPNIIDKYKPNLLIECFKKLNKTERSDLFDTIADHGYTLYAVEDFTSIENIIRLGKKDILGKKQIEILAMAENILDA